MAWVGHEDAALTLRIYTQVRERPQDPRILPAMARIGEGERVAPSVLRAA
jgi:hypothetical protein